LAVAGARDTRIVGTGAEESALNMIKSTFSLTDDQLDTIKRRMQLADALKQHTTITPQMKTFFMNMTDAQRTALMGDMQMTRLQSLTQRLNGKQMLDVYEAASPTERKELVAPMVNKLTAYAMTINDPKKQQEFFNRVREVFKNAKH
jgi:hypothetical protein